MDADVAPSPGGWAQLPGGGGSGAATAAASTSSTLLPSLLTALDDAACCSICRDFLEAPMVLECGHACEFREREKKEKRGERRDGEGEGCDLP